MTSGRHSRARVRRSLAGLAAGVLWFTTAGAQITRDAVPGGLVEIPLAPVEQVQPEAFFGQHRVLVTDLGSRWVGLVGLPFSLVPGTYVMQARLAGGQDLVTREFTVYPRRISKRPVLELAEMPFDTTIDFAWRDNLDAELPLDAPLAVPAEPMFGRYRQVSESRSEYVDFVTFRVTANTRVTAPDHGRVAAIESDETGSYVWIDHGMALFTCVGPITDTTVEPKDAVEARQPIGQAGPDAEGAAVTVYWSVYLNGAAVNPSLVSDIEAQPADAARDPGGTG